MNISNDWRESTRSLRDKLQYILTNENTQQDVVIVAGSGSTETKFKAHRCILCMGSQVLENLLEQGKINDEGMKEIKLPDVRPEALKFVLQYIYTDSCNVPHEDIMYILYASFKLNLTALAALCISKLKDELSAANVLKIFDESIKMNVEELVQTTQQYILKNSREVFIQEQFLSITQETLCKLLASDELEMDEISIFNSMMRWGKAACSRSEFKENSENLRVVLQNIIPLIRFTVMPIQEFATIVVPTNILHHQQVIDVYNYLSTSNSPGKQSQPPSWIFTSAKRKLKSGESGSSTYSNNPETNPTEYGENLHEHNMQFKNTTKDQLLQYLKSISGKKTISGVAVESKDAECNEGIQTIQKIAGVHPGILSLPMPSYMHSVTAWQLFTEKVISYWKNGYLVHIIWWSAQHPLSQLGIFKNRDYKRWIDLIQDDGRLNREWKKRLDNIVPYLKQLEYAGVVVICDIVPWIHIKEFVWGGRPRINGNGSVKLYQLTHDYLTQKHQLHSLLWTWSFDIGIDPTQLEQFFPGNEYVDVVSIHAWDIKQVPKNLYQKLLEIVGDKPISMECVRTVPSLTILTLQPRWTWFTTPIDCLEASYYNDNAKVKTTFQGLWIINKESNEFFKTLNSN